MKLAVSRASSSEPSTRIGPELAGRRDPLGRLGQLLHRPQAGPGHRRPGERGQRHADATDRGQRDAEPGQHGAGGVEPLPDHQRAALPRVDRHHPVLHPAVGRGPHRRRGLATGHRQLLLAQRRRRRRAPRRLGQPVLVEQREPDVPGPERAGRGGGQLLRVDELALRRGRRALQQVRVERGEDVLPDDEERHDRHEDHRTRGGHGGEHPDPGAQRDVPGRRQP